ncbi:hypothetical protein [uncultured Fibrella sp.]|uniref:hypothetical protein n=1 Tax=uncultured Fibrella sp. TaxID=1284596 RepID=UPI0035CA6691
MKNYVPVAWLLISFGLLTGGNAAAQSWAMTGPKTMLTDDCQHILFGRIDTDNHLVNAQGYPIGRVFADSYDPKLTIKFFLNGQPNNIEQSEPNGAILGATEYSGTLKESIRKLYYRAPSRMPAKNPVEIKAIVTPATGPPITVTAQIYVLAEDWTFEFFQALRYKCYEGGTSNPRNGLAVDMGMATGMRQQFYFEAGTINFFTGEATATLNGDPEIYHTKKYAGGVCDPTYLTANLLWGDDDQSKIKNVKARFTGTQMKVDYQIDYMNYLGWTFTEKTTGKTIPGPPRRPGSHNVQAGFQCPLQTKFRSLYKTPVDQQIMLHVVGGIQLHTD